MVGGSRLSLRWRPGAWQKLRLGPLPRPPYVHHAERAVAYAAAAARGPAADRGRRGLAAAVALRGGRRPGGLAAARRGPRFAVAAGDAAGGRWDRKSVV